MLPKYIRNFLEFAARRGATFNDDLFEDPNSIYNYMTEETVARLEERYASELQISFDVNKVSYKLWTREGGIDAPFVFNHDTAPQQLLDNHFDPNRPTKVLSHGFSSDVGFAEPFAKGNFELLYDSNVLFICVNILFTHTGMM